jgi:hypothetical protein
MSIIDCFSSISLDLYTYTCLQAFIDAKTRMNMCETSAISPDGNEGLIYAVQVYNVKEYTTVNMSY